jgi:hypothetical protein
MGGGLLVAEINGVTVSGHPLESFLAKRASSGRDGHGEGEAERLAAVLRCRSAAVLRCCRAGVRQCGGAVVRRWRSAAVLPCRGAAVLWYRRRRRDSGSRVVAS